jgi:hypothetical protein
MGLDPDVVISPFSPGFDFTAFTNTRRQCNRVGCGNDGTMKCGRCNNARYCSRKCQVAHWKEKHKSVCQHPNSYTTFVGEIPSSWITTSSSSAVAESSLLPPHSVRIVYDDTHMGKSIDHPSIYSMGSRPSVLSYLEHHSPDSDGSFTICLSNGSGTFVSDVIQTKFSSFYSDIK